MASSISQTIEVSFHLLNFRGCHLFAKILRSSSNCSKYWGLLPFAKILRLSSILKKIVWHFHLPNYWGCIPFAKLLWSSSICQNIEVVFHLPKNWGRLRNWFLLDAWKVTWLTFNENCWKINFPRRVGVGGWLDSLTISQPAGAWAELGNN